MIDEHVKGDEKESQKKWKNSQKRCNMSKRDVERCPKDVKRDLQFTTCHTRSETHTCMSEYVKRDVFGKRDVQPPKNGKIALWLATNGSISEVLARSESIFTEITEYIYLV